MCAAPDGSGRLDGAKQICSQSPKLHNKKLVIVDAPSGRTSSTIEENLGFWIDETAKTIVLADGMPLTVRRFDGTWISATRGDMSYELDRQNGNLTYASSITQAGSSDYAHKSGQGAAILQPVRRANGKFGIQPFRCVPGST